jgi:DNA-binding NarL/FixJ family response regulator
MSLICILLVDDFAPWRRFVSSVVQKEPELQIISEASDGLEALQKAKELKPDLILMDIGLPKLNGIDVARRVREVASPPKVLFLSQEFSPGVVRDALSLGAQGYVHKLQAQSELLPAIEAVLEGKRFVSSGLTDDDFREGTIAKSTDINELRKEKDVVSAELTREFGAPQYSWQPAVMDAFRAPRDFLPGRINIAERAIAARLKVSCETERLVLKRALRALHVLLEETLPQCAPAENEESA